MATAPRQIALWLMAIGIVAPAQPTLQRARDLIALKEYKAAGESLDALLLDQPDNVEIRYLRGLAAAQADDYATAISHLRKASLLAPDQAQVLKLLVKSLMLAGQSAQSEPILQRLVRLAPDDAESWSLLGRHHQVAQRYDRALDPLTRALLLRPNDAITLTSLANTYVGLNDSGKALDAFQKAVAANQSAAKPLADPHASFAIHLLRLDRIREAEAQFQLARSIDPRNPLAVEAGRALERRAANVQMFSQDEEITPPQFHDIAAAAGLNFRLENSPTSEKHQIETMPGGLAVLDYDNDGFLDIYFTNGAESPSLKKSSPRFHNRLFRNNGDLTFTDVTAAAGVSGTGYMMGAGAADFDNDGFTDLFVAGVGRNILYRNNGKGSFMDITAAAGLDRPHAKYGRMWAVHAAWLDYDRDGWLDLLVINYCLWNPKTEPFCGDADAGRRWYCHPRTYDPLPNQLFRNNGDGTFTDVSERSGIGGHLGKGMGAAVADFDGDGWPDVYVANDTEANFLFRNRRDGTFEEVALQHEVAFNQFGKAVSSMGVDAKDLDNDGKPDLFVTDLSNEGFLLFRNHGKVFQDMADRARVTLASLPYTGWSNPIADFNNDGWKDMFSANGHVDDTIELAQSRTYRQRNSLFLNMGGGLFRDVSESVGKDFQDKRAHRGAAAADFDNDGRQDIVTSSLGGAPELFHNVSRHEANWLTIHLAGRASNRSGLGALIKIETDDGRALWNHATTSVGYASSSDPRVHFGLGRSQRIKRLEILWPSGQRQILSDIAAGQILRVTEPEP